MNIEKNKSLRYENLLSLRKKMTQAQVQEEMMKIGSLLNETGARKNGSIVTATFSVENGDGQPILDMEILVPLDRPAILPQPYILKPVFQLVNAVYARHQGNPNLLQNTYHELLQYITNNQMQQITAAYNVNVNDLQPGQSLEEMIIDVYIGINPSIL